MAAENLSKKLEIDIEAALLQSNANANGLSLLVAALDAKTESNPLSPVSSVSSEKRKNSDTTETYWERRKRNNEAAKKSREKRRLNDLAMESRLLELSRENSLLRSELLKLNPTETTSVTPSLNTANLPTLIHQLLAPTTLLSTVEPNDLTVPGRKRATLATSVSDKMTVQGQTDVKTPTFGLSLLNALINTKESQLDDDDSVSLKNCLSTLSVPMGEETKLEENSEESQSDEQLSSPHWESSSSASPSSNGHNKSAKERYVERRKRNNEAAKRCRANRRVMYEFRTRRIDELQLENNSLKAEVLKLSRELLLLKNMVALRQSAKLHI